MAPIKIQLCDVSGSNQSSADVAVTALGLHQVSNVALGQLEDPGNANPDLTFRYSSGEYVFNLSTRGLSTGTYMLMFTAGQDPSTHSVTFQVK